MSPAQRRPTLDAIARSASVSLATVSKVLNGRSGVSAATRQRVESVLAASGYAQRGVPPEHGDVVELVVAELTSEWSVEIIRGVGQVAHERGLVLALSDLADHRHVGDDWMSGVLRRRPAAVVLQFSDLGPEDRDRLRTRNIPFAVVDPAGDPPDDVPSVRATNRAGGASATQHLLDLGHRRIGAITGPSDLLCAVARFAGHRDALRSVGLVPDPATTGHGAFTRADGEREARRILTASDRPTAIVAGNDLQALGVYDAAAAAGLRIPEDLSVVGFDDVAPAQWARPPLTTVRQPLRAMAAAATRIALRLRDADEPGAGRPAPVEQVELATTLVERASTAPPPRKVSGSAA